MPQQPPPLTPVRNYPSPVVSDFMLLDEWNTELPTYKALDYGTAHPNTRDFPNHKLVFQKPSRTEKWVQRYWARDEVDPDTFNYAIEYVEEGGANPIYVRTYRVLRSAYTRGTDLSPDPVHASAFLTQEKTQNYEPGSEYYGLYIKVIRIYETLPGPLLQEQEYLRQLDVQIPTTRQRVKSTAAGVGTNRRTIRAINKNVSEVVTIDQSAIAAVLNAYVLAFPSTASVIDFPPILTAIKAVTSSSKEDGTYKESSTGAGSGTNFFHSNEASARVSGGASIAPDLIIETTKLWARAVPIVSYFFFMPLPVTLAQILTKLSTLTGATIAAWPRYKPQSHTIIVTGGSKSAEAQARAKGQFSSSSSGFSYASTVGQGTSKRTVSSIRHVHISETIHDVITIDTSQFQGSESFSVRAEAAGEVTILGATLGGDIVEGPNTFTVYAGITPATLPATTPTGVSALTGKVILHSNGEPFGYGFARYTAEILDMADVV